MEVRHLKKYLNIFFSTLIFLIVLFSGGRLEISPAHAFFENQVRYAFEHRWLPMLSDSASEKRFQAMQAFLAFPEWGLPVLRKSIISPESDGYHWQIAMLIGMLGDSSDAPPLLEIWRELKNRERSEVWLGSVQRLYWKNYLPNEIPPKLTSLSVNFLKTSAEGEKDIKTASLQYRIDNPSPVPRFIRVGAHFWRTRTQENLSDKYYWIPTGGRIESSMQVRIFPVAHSNSMRLDFRVWEVGVSEPLLHQSGRIPSPR